MAKIYTTEKLPKNIKITKAGILLKTLNQKERDKLDKKVTKALVELNFLNSSKFPRANKYAELTEEEIRVKLNEFKSNNIRPISKELKKFSSYKQTGRSSKHSLLKVLFPEVFFDRKLLGE